MNTAPTEPPGDECHVIEFPARSERVELEFIFRRENRRLLHFLKIRLGSDTDAQDAAQMTFLRFWQRRETLDRTNLVALLFVIARNVAIDMLRRRTRTSSVCADTEWDQVAAVRDPGIDPERALASKQELASVLKLLDGLPAKCRAAFISYHIDQMTYAEIAERMNITQNMVRKHVIRAIVHCAANFKYEEE